MNDTAIDSIDVILGLSLGCLSVASVGYLIYALYLLVSKKKFTQTHKILAGLSIACLIIFLFIWTF